MKIIIRQETINDYSLIYEVVKVAFEQGLHTNGDEPNLVNRLRLSDSYIPQLSLVAEYEGMIVGHIFFTKMKIGKFDSLSLAPLAVLPQYQNHGIGGMLIEEGHRIACQLGYRSVVLVGHPNYYPRFGYLRASGYGIQAPFEVPDECFLVKELVEDGLKEVRGVIAYPKEFFMNEGTL